MTIAIRNSDIATFKECREKWNFSSPHKLNLRPNKQTIHFGFGTAIHKGVEVWYKLPDSYNNARAIKAFAASWSKFMDDCFDPAEWLEYRDLGVEMLKGYFKFATQNDAFKPVRAEVEFEVPILVPKDLFDKMPMVFARTPAGELLYKGEPVVFQGRLDAVGEDEHGYVLVETKTTGRWGDLTFLDMDEQTTRYPYALWRLGLAPHTVWYNQLLKAMPCKPELLKSGKLSKSKAALGVTHDLYVEAISEHGLRLSDYRDHLEWLALNPPDFFRRTPIHKTHKEYEVIGRRLFLEAIDMLNSPSIYPTPTNNYNCINCAFREPCLALNEGNSPNFILKNGYHERTPDE